MKIIVDCNGLVHLLPNNGIFELLCENNIIMHGDQLYIEQNMLSVFENVVAYYNIDNKKKILMRKAKIQKILSQNEQISNKKKLE